MKENNQIEVSLLTYILVVVVGLSLIIGYLVKHLNRNGVEKETLTVEELNNKLEANPFDEPTLEESMRLFN